MRDKVFLDTNIFIYLYSETEIFKRNAAYQLFDNYYCVTSLQVMNEASNVWFKKYGWNGAKIRQHLDNIELICDEIVTTTRETINVALTLKGQYGYAYYDCLMLSFALSGSCGIIFTEDMTDKQIINEKLIIANPFS